MNFHTPILLYHPKNSRFYRSIISTYDLLLYSRAGKQIAPDNKTPRRYSDTLFQIATSDCLICKNNKREFTFYNSKLYLKYTPGSYYHPSSANNQTDAGVCIDKTTMKTLILILMAMISINSQGQNKKNSLSGSIPASHVDHKVTVVNFDKLETILKKNDNKLYVINFWATWCKPCVMELPEFMEVNKMYRSNPHFNMSLVSLDLAKEVETTVRPFLQKNNMDIDVYLLDDNKRMNMWIPAIDKSWSGAIPATVFYRNGKKLEFKEGKLEKSELLRIIHKYL